MRILCNGFGWFDAAAGVARERHDVVAVSDESLDAAWNDGAAGDWWRALVPAGWEPDVALFCSPEYRLMPPRMAELPCPVALWVGDWYANADPVLAVADQADLVLADATGIEALRRAGVEHVEECCPWTFDPALHRPDWDARPARDVGFLGNVNDAIQHERNRWIARFASSLDERSTVHAGGGRRGKDYVRYLQESRISFNRSVTGDVNMRCFEVPACGSLLLVDRESLPQVARWFEPGREVVAYGNDDLEQVVQYYLEHEDERAAIARAGWERVQEHAPAPRLGRLLSRLEELAGAGISRRLTAMTPAASAAAAAQALAISGTPPWGGAEQVLEAAEAGGASSPSLHVNRGALYFGYTAGLAREEAAQAINWADEQFRRALELDPSDAVAMLDRVALADGVGATAAAHAAALDLVARIEAGTAWAAPGRIVVPVGVTRLHLAWQEAILSGSDDMEARLTRLALAEAHRLAAKTATADAALEARHLRRSLACFDQPDTRHALARALMRTGDVTAAVTELEALIDERPQSPAAWTDYIRLLVATGRRGDARAFFDWCRRLTGRIEFRDPEIVARLESEIAARVPARA